METRELETYLALNQRLGSCDWHRHDVCFSFPLLCTSMALAEAIADVAIRYTGNVIFCYNVTNITYVCLSYCLHTCMPICVRCNERSRRGCPGP